MSHRKLSVLDKLITQVDHGIRTVLFDAPSPDRESPADEIQQDELSDKDRDHAIGLM